GSSSVTFKPLSSKYNRHNFFRNPKTPVIPAVFQGLACSSGPKNISYKRKVSAPYSLQMSSGFTTLKNDFDIFSTSRPTTNLSLSSLMNIASLNSSLHCFILSISNSSDKFNNDTSIRIGSNRIKYSYE